MKGSKYKIFVYVSLLLLLLVEYILNIYMYLNGLRFFRVYVKFYFKVNIWNKYSFVLIYLYFIKKKILFVNVCVYEIKIIVMNLE